MGYRTSRIVIRSGGKHRAFYQITRENMRHAKAVYNTTLFHIRNLYTGLNKDEGERTKNENEVIARVCAAIADVNSKRILKGEAPYALPTPQKPWLPGYLWTSVMNRILKEFLPRPETFYSKLEQTTVQQACADMTSFLASLKKYRKHPEQYLGRPRLPHYIKTDTFTLNYDCQMAECCGEGRHHRLKLKAVPSVLKIGKKRFENIVSVRLAYRHGEIVASVCVKEIAKKDPADTAIEKIQASNLSAAQKRCLTERVLRLKCYRDRLAAYIEAQRAPLPDRMLGIDPGVQNFLTVCPGFGSEPFLIRGGRLKAANQYYNKKRAALQCQLKKDHDRYTSHRLDRLEAHRDNFLYNYFHQTACLVVDYALRERAGTIVIGRNKGWKQKVEMGRKENQRFVYIPFARFFEVLEDKATRAGIQVVYTEESYTSRACSLTRDPLPAYGAQKEVPNSLFHGRRPKRGLYVCEDGRKLNADVNGAANILRKYSETGLQEDLSYLTGPVRVLKVA